MNAVSWKPSYGYIQIRREHDGLSALLPWRVYINGECRGYVRRREAVSFMVQPGEHVVQVSSGISASHAIIVAVAREQRVALVSRPQQWPFRPQATTLTRAWKSSPSRQMRIVLEHRY